MASFALDNLRHTKKKQGKGGGKEKGVCEIDEDNVLENFGGPQGLGYLKGT